MSEPSGPLSEPPQSLVRAILAIARPLVRLLIAKGITLPYLTNLLKSVYVQVAETQFKVEEGAPSVSRLSVLTGLQRRDIKRIQEAPPPDRAPPQALSLGSRLMAIWAGDARYRDSAGKPRPLPRSSTDPTTPSFDQLMREVSKDVRPKAILDELLRLGLAVMDGDMIHLNAAGFVPQGGFDEKAYFLGRNVADHVAASAHNLIGGGAPLLERAVYYDKLTAASLAHLSNRARELGTEALLAFNREALACADKDANAPDAEYRMALGVYYFEGPDDTNPGDPDKDSSK